MQHMVQQHPTENGLSSRPTCGSLLLQVTVAQKVTVGVYKGVTTSELDELAAETAASMTATHPDYALVSVHMAALIDADWLNECCLGRSW